MSYGPHPNDFLFAECKYHLYPCVVSAQLTCEDGFFLDKNDCETIYLDDIIFRDLSPSLQEELNLQQYYGYVIFPSILITVLSPVSYLTVPVTTK